MLLVSVSSALQPENSTTQSTTAEWQLPGRSLQSLCSDQQLYNESRQQAQSRRLGNRHMCGQPVTGSDE